MSDEWARVREALARDPERARQWARIVGEDDERALVRWWELAWVCQAQQELNEIVADHLIAAHRRAARLEAQVFALWMAVLVLAVAVVLALGVAL